LTVLLLEENAIAEAAAMQSLTNGIKLMVKVAKTVTTEHL
jgi:hypothetical protein